MMHDARRDEPSTLAGPESLDFVIYEIDNNGHNGSDETDLSSYGENGHSVTQRQIPSAYQIEESVANDAEPPDDWQECISIVEQGDSVSKTETVRPASEVKMIAQTPEGLPNPASTASPVQQDLLPRSNSTPALGSISDLLKSRPASTQQPPQPLPVLPDRRPVESRRDVVRTSGGNGGSQAVQLSIQPHVPVRPESQLMGGTQLINLYEKGQRDFSGTNLRQANLQGARLQNARMIMADLLKADMSCSELSGARLIQANMEEANLQGAILTRAKLTGANLRGADLRNADLEDADLSGADLTGADLLGANLLGARLTGAKLEHARLNPNWELVWQIVSTETDGGKAE
jgi:hypothetical protein